MRCATRYGAIAFLAGAALLCGSSIAGLEAPRILATILLVGAAICIGASAGGSTTDVWFARLRLLSPRTFASIIIAVLLAPALIALIQSLVYVVLGWSHRGASPVVVGFVVGVSLLVTIAGAAAAAWAGVYGREHASRPEDQQ